MLTARSIMFEEIDENTKLWRYMDLPKLLSMITNNELYFCRADKFDDPYEGSYPNSDKENRDFILRAMKHNNDPHISNHVNSTTYQALVKYFNISCWHMNEHESLAMWNCYTSKGNGIAIQTTYKKLKESLGSLEFDPKFDIYLGKVSYKDYKTCKSEGTVNEIIPFFMKRTSYEHEKEFRVAVLNKSSEGVDENGHLVGKPYEYGKNLNIDMKNLIDNIYLAPKTPSWQYDLIKKLANDLLRKDVSLYNSSLDDEALF